MAHSQYLIMADVLVQTRVPTPVGTWLKRKAGLEGDTVAGLVRRMLVGEASAPGTLAWLRHLRECEPAIFLISPPKPEYRLERLRHVDADALLVALQAPDGRPIAPQEWRSTSYFPKLQEYRIVLEGSSTPWEVRSDIFNRTAKRLELVITADRLFPRNIPK
jgi:hypothetical protein